LTDKKTFGSFIRTKRCEKEYSQKDLAEQLFVTEGAVSKWERGISYPDITLISEICRVLDISEHELITASTDTEARRIKHDARKFRVIRSTWFWVPTISYALALLTCFICNLAVNHTLSWFFIVLASLICAYTFIPTVTLFFRSNKLLVFSLSSYLSICLLLLTCALYTRDLSWFLTACLGILMGYELVFVPILLAKSRWSRYKFAISFAAAFALTLLLLINVNLWHPFRLLPALGIACYAFAPAILCTLICTFRLDAFTKTGLCTACSAVLYYFTDHVVAALLGTDNKSYSVNFYNWDEYAKGNVLLIVLMALLFVAAVFFVLGIYRAHKNKTS